MVTALKIIFRLLMVFLLEMGLMAMFGCRYEEHYDYKSVKFIAHDEVVIWEHEGPCNVWNFSSRRYKVTWPDEDGDGKREVMEFDLSSTTTMLRN